jgi:hypothetical protein
MPVSPQSQNFISELMQWAEIELAQLDKAQSLRARWDQNAIADNIDDATIIETESFAHLTEQKIVDGVTAMTAVITALGDFSSGQAVNLLKLKG